MAINLIEFVIWSASDWPADLILKTKEQQFSEKTRLTKIPWGILKHDRWRKVRTYKISEGLTIIALGVKYKSHVINRY